MWWTETYTYCKRTIANLRLIHPYTDLQLPTCRQSSLAPILPSAGPEPGLRTSRILLPNSTVCPGLCFLSLQAGLGGAEVSLAARRPEPPFCPFCPAGFACLSVCHSLPLLQKRPGRFRASANAPAPARFHCQEQSPTELKLHTPRTLAWNSDCWKSKVSASTR